jgi:tight adherence protein B
MKYKEQLKELAVYGLFAAILYLFYRSLWSFILLPPAIFFYHRFNAGNLKKKRREELARQFKDALSSMTAALRAGYSVENSISESLKEMCGLYSETAPICTELSMVINEIRLGISVENSLISLAERTDVEDINTFATVFSIAKRSGGDLVEIIRKTSDDIASKIDTQSEIAVLISAKKFEQTIMTFTPLGIIIYIGISSPELLSPLYGNVPGIVIMTLCLCIYIIA